MLRFTMLLWLTSMARGDIRLSVPGLGESGCYVEPGDLYIGATFPFYRKGSTEKLCSDIFYQTNSHRFQLPEFYAFGIKMVNQRKDVLPNITLGFTIFDDCGWDIGALAKTLYFAPLEEDGVRLAMEPGMSNCSSGITRHYPVVAVTGLTNSAKAVMMSSFLSIFQIPSMGIYATSDELSDKLRYEYFLRLTPPDRYQVEALLDFIDYFKWNYISLLFSEGSYGENGAKGVDKGAKQRGICIAVSQMFDYEATKRDVDQILSKLLKNLKARVVILFLSQDDGLKLMHAVEERNAGGEFIWLGADSIGIRDLIPVANGTFAIHHDFIPIDPTDFSAYLASLTPNNHSQNAWIYKIWEEHFNCEWQSLNTNNSCQRYADKSYGDVPYYITTTLALVVDAIHCFAYGLDALIREMCPNAFSDKSLLQNCIKGPQLLQHIKALRFQGTSGFISFDSVGDVQGRYMIKQHRYTPEREETEVALWNKAFNSITVYEENIDWNHFKFWHGADNKSIEVVCSKPCKQKEFAIRLEQPCCWLCRVCRENEIIINSSKCQLCPSNTWPDNATDTLCEDIDPDFLKWTDALSVGLYTMTIFGMISWCLTMFIYVKNWKVKLVKASSRELSLIILIGIVIAYLGVFAYLSAPGIASCHLRRHMFTFSVVLIYGPLFMKTNRVYRIFLSGKKGKMAKLVGTLSQMIFTSGIVFLQVILSVISALLFPTNPDLQMQIPTIKYVELHCLLPLGGLVIPMSLNLLLLFLCAIHGFFTRKLPENFNESWYIFVSVSTTAFLWLVFLPTYFTTFYAYHKAALMSFCLIVNASITLLCLYIPKIYAIYYVSEDKIKYTNSSERTGTTTIKSAQSTSSKVAPVSQ